MIHLLALFPLVWGVFFWRAIHRPGAREVIDWRRMFVRFAVSVGQIQKAMIEVEAGFARLAAAMKKLGRALET